MKNLWTPWRMEHVQGLIKNNTACLFDPPGTSNHDKAHLLLYRDKLVVILLNRFPYANGHLLVAPCRHLADITDLADDEHLHLMQMLAKSCAILRGHLHPHGINIGLNLGESAGAGIADHLHFHVVPRWEGDHNFMTVCADIRTIPQHIDATFDMLLQDFQNLLPKESSR